MDFIVNLLWSSKTLDPGLKYAHVFYNLRVNPELENCFVFKPRGNFKIRLSVIVYSLKVSNVFIILRIV